MGLLINWGCGCKHVLGRGRCCVSSSIEYIRNHACQKNRRKRDNLHQTKMPKFHNALFLQGENTLEGEIGPVARDPVVIGVVDAHHRGQGPRRIALVRKAGGRRHNWLNPSIDPKRGPKGAGVPRGGADHSTGKHIFFAELMMLIFYRIHRYFFPDNGKEKIDSLQTLYDA